MKLKTKFRIALLILYTAGLLAFFSFTCASDSPARENKEQPAQTTDVHLAAQVPQASSLSIPRRVPEVPTTSSPILSCILNDISASMNRTSAARALTVEHVVMLTDFIGETGGGSIGVGHISTETEPLVMLRIPPPEWAGPPTTASNVFTRNKMMREFEKAEPEREARETKRRGNNQLLIEDFLQDLEVFFAVPTNGRFTNLWHGLRRCELYLLADAEYWTRTTGNRPKLYVLIRSDGIHDVEHSEFTPLDPSIEVLLITGSKDIGDLDQLDPPPRLFESPTTAILSITSNVGGN